MNLSREEQETIILFNEAEQTAIVDTCNKRLRKQLAQYCSENLGCSLISEDDTHAKYVCPKSWVKIRKPRQLSDEQREKLASRAKQNFHVPPRNASEEIAYIRVGLGMPPINQTDGGLPCGLRKE